MGSNSILTNPEAFVALRNLERTNTLLATTQNRVATGLKVTGAVDDASNFAIAQGIRGDIRALGAVTQGLNNSKGIGNVALAGLVNGGAKLVHPGGAKLVHLTLCGPRCWGLSR